MKSLELEQIEICDKPVYIFEDHSIAFKAWHKIKENFGNTPYVISLDHHTDTMGALRNFAMCEYSKEKAYPTTEGYLDQIQMEHLYSIDINDEGSMDCLVMKLKHDEHIDAAIKKEIISHSISIQWDDGSGTDSIEEIKYNSQPTQMELIIELGLEEGKRKYSELKESPVPPFNYEMPDSKMFIVGYSHFQRLGIDDGLYDLALEDEFLENQFEIVNNMNKNSGLPEISDGGYILDIDLDYFHTQKSIQPDSQIYFSNLVKNASAITIAKESGCVLYHREDGEKITSESLLQDILGNIENILSN